MPPADEGLCLWIEMLKMALVEGIEVENIEFFVHRFVSRVCLKCGAYNRGNCLFIRHITENLEKRRV